MERAIIAINQEQIKKIICDIFQDECELAIRVFSAESGLRPDAVGDSGKSVGISQINIVHWNKVNCDLFEPECNIKLAKQIRDSSGWMAWSVYRKGVY